MKRIFLSLILFLCLSISVYSKLPTLEDEHYKRACGPIAGVVALQTLGIETSLDEMTKRSCWERDKMLPLKNLQKAIHSYRGIDCHTVQLSPSQLIRLLNDDQATVILAVRKRTDEIDHAVCAIGVQNNGQVIHLIDYPELHQRKLIAELADSWDGSALVVRVSPFYRALGDFALCFGPMVAVILGVLWFRHRKDKPVVNESQTVCEPTSET